MNITTERLLLRTIELKDSESVFKYRSDAEANKFQSWIPENLKDVEDFIQNKVCASFSVPDTWYQLVIIIKESGELIGDIGIHFLGSESDQIEIGITIDKIIRERDLHQKP